MDNSKLMEILFSKDIIGILWQGPVISIAGALLNSTKTSKTVQALVPMVLCVGLTLYQGRFDKGFEDWRDYVANSGMLLTTCISFYKAFEHVGLKALTINTPGIADIPETINNIKNALKGVHHEQTPEEEYKSRLQAINGLVRDGLLTEEQADVSRGQLALELGRIKALKQPEVTKNESV